MITPAQLQKFAPKILEANVQPLVNAINECITRFSLNTPRRLRYFMAQTSYETQGYTAFSENLYYTTPEQLCKVWPTHFTMGTATATLAHAPDYIKNPQKLGNYIYSGKYGNGSVASGDGYNFRGQGCIQVTFKANYDECSQYLFTDDRLTSNPLLIQSMDVAMLTAGWFWVSHGSSGYKDINAMADGDQFTLATKTINGSTDTVQARLAVLNIANTIF